MPGGRPPATRMAGGASWRQLVRISTPRASAHPWYMLPLTASVTAIEYLQWQPGLLNNLPATSMKLHMLYGGANFLRIFVRFFLRRRLPRLLSWTAPWVAAEMAATATAAEPGCYPPCAAGLAT